jgi:threonine dehydrogenase-like Zn-dependent dehydrogenase
MIRKSLYFTGPYQVSLREEPLAAPGPGQVLVRTLMSAISPGTELLIYRGQAPREMAADATLASLPGSLAFPLKYGYAAVGRVAALGPEVAAPWQDKLVFASSPTKISFWRPRLSFCRSPWVWPRRKPCFCPTWKPRSPWPWTAGPSSGRRWRFSVRGSWGLLLTALLARFPLAKLVTLDRYPHRRLASESLGAHASLDPWRPRPWIRRGPCCKGTGRTPGPTWPTRFPATPRPWTRPWPSPGSTAAWSSAPGTAKKTSELHLGGLFHRQRQVLLSSQVSTIAPELTGRWDKARLQGVAWRLVQEITPARFITHRFPLAQAEQAYQLLDQNPGEAIQVILTLRTTPGLFNLRGFRLARPVVLGGLVSYLIFTEIKPAAEEDDVAGKLPCHFS